MKPLPAEPDLVDLSQRILTGPQESAEGLQAALGLLDSWAAAGWTRSTHLHLKSSDPDAALAYWCARVFKRGLRNVTWDGARIHPESTAGAGAANFAMTPEFMDSGELLAVLRSELEAQRAMCILDAGFLRFWPDYAALAASHNGVIVYDPAESTKRLETIADWATRLVGAQNSHRTKGGHALRVWSVGGGITGDLAGFFAGLFGLEHYSSPTTLLSTYDASLGGKTGANLPPWGKNQIGLFYPTSRWVIVPAHFSTLDDIQVLAAMAEAIKHCWLAGDCARNHLSAMASLCEAIRKRAAAAHPDRAATPLWDDHFLRSSISFNHKIKAAFVTVDPREEGVRAALNLGHTVGHVLEGLADEGWIKPLAHGLAVAVGLKFLLANRLLDDDHGQFEQVLDGLLVAAGCETPFQVSKPAGSDAENSLAERFWDRFVALARADKKNTADIRLVLPQRGLAGNDALMRSPDLSLFRTVTAKDLVDWCCAVDLFRF